MLTSLNSFFEGTLQHNVSRVLDEREEWLLDTVTSGAGSIATKNGQSKFTGAKSGGFPAAGRGTQGFAKLFNGIHAVNFT